MKTPISRRIFFWSLFTSYFIVTGTVLFFVFGYRHDFQRNIFVHTGSLTLKANPQEISIKLNEKNPKSSLVNIINDSYFITGLRPKTYSVSVSRDGFKSWDKEVNIHSGISTEFWNIELLRNNYERTAFDISDIDRFFPAPEETTFATTRQLGKVLTVNVFNTKKNNISNAFIFPQAEFTSSAYENIEWSPTSKELIIPIMPTNGERIKDFAIGYIKTNNSLYLSDIVPEISLQSVRWDPDEKNTIYALSEAGDLLRIALPENIEEINVSQVSKNVLAYDFADDGIYLLNTSGELFYSGDKKEIKSLEILTLFDINNEHMSYRLIAYDNHRVALIDDVTENFYLYNKGKKDIYTKKLGSNIVGAHFSDDGKKLLFYSLFEVFIHFTRDWNTQPIRGENQTQSIIRFSQELDNIHFSKDYEHIIYTAGNDVKITELDYRGNRITDTIVTLNESDNTIINKHKMNRLLFIDSINESKRQLQAIEFPEKETLF